MASKVSVVEKKVPLIMGQVHPDTGSKSRLHLALRFIHKTSTFDGIWGETGKGTQSARHSLSHSGRRKLIPILFRIPIEKISLHIEIVLITARDFFSCDRIATGSCE